MLLFASVAFAFDPFTECPEITVPADAVVYRYNEAGLDVTFDELHAAAYAYWDDGCAWVETTTGSTTERVCEGTDATVTWTETYAEDSWPYTTTETWTLTVEVPVGETWTAITVSATESDWSYTGSSYGGGHVWSASWTGSFGDLPDDGWFRVTSGSSNSSGSNSSGLSVETPACAYSWSYQDQYGEAIWESVHAPDHVVNVYWGVNIWCEDPWYSYADIDAARFGAVDHETWEADATDLDGDGWTGVNDCDETDAGRNVCEAVDVANDGVDQDCDGSDRVDADIDGDGHDMLSMGGDDCDDANAGVHPYANDPAGDGIDQDCDGADDVDADGDGFTSDGDDRAADCDDTDNHMYPGRPDTPYDGVDEDCDGADVTDYDGDGEDAVEVGGPDCDDADFTVYSTAPEVECDGIDQDCDGADECPPPVAEEDPEEEERAPVEEEAGGCAGGAALLLLLPLATRRRRPC